MRTLLWMLVCCSFVPLSLSAEDNTRTALVRDFIAAYNAHDSAAMAALVTEDVQWLSIAGDKIAVETDGKAALVAGMDSYFESCPSCQSSLRSLMASRDRVSAIEVATWDGKNGPQEQSGMSVYEFSGSLIRRVYYFPAEK